MAWAPPWATTTAMGGPISTKSIDITSAASCVGFSVYGYQNIGLVGSRLANDFSPNLARAVSDFDLTQQMNVNWIADLPIGKGRALAGNVSGVVNAFIGGWQVSGLARWTSGFPFSVDGGQRWPTNWFLTARSEEHTSELQSQFHLVCRLLLETKNRPTR